MRFLNHVMTSEETDPATGAIVTHLSISRISDLSVDELARAIQFYQSENLQKVSLYRGKGEGLANYTIEELTTFFESIPGSISTMDLSSAGLAFIQDDDTIEKLSQLLDTNEKEYILGDDVTSQKIQKTICQRQVQPAVTSILAMQELEKTPGATDFAHRFFGLPTELRQEILKECCTSEPSKHTHS